ncbi:uncharacterized protein BCR38DRAFT_71042 [Pseudomassariella vexata]|uniref:Uncharacterized protein n=1 Tax=Pseudomassariella vexata TaxID=1141098 RepID=A0A1Y2DI14_9PEZI|nr:uncharacterized protein BCR38DRAFT_71042 [Pseudomassariella vexata]ORY58871.1 hypothetical protein BCR38DRAFT_71042 [Pseudomassariella vexata]
MSTPKSSLIGLQASPRADSRVKDIALLLIAVLHLQFSQVIWYLSTSEQKKHIPSMVEVLKSLVYQIVRMDTGILAERLYTITAEKLNPQLSKDEWLCLLYLVLEHQIFHYRGSRGCLQVLQAKTRFYGSISESVPKDRRSVF